MMARQKAISLHYCLAHPDIYLWDLPHNQPTTNDQLSMLKTTNYHELAINKMSEILKPTSVFLDIRISAPVLLSQAYFLFLNNPSFLLPDSFPPTRNARQNSKEPLDVRCARAARDDGNWQFMCTRSFTTTSETATPSGSSVSFEVSMEMHLNFGMFFHLTILRTWRYREDASLCTFRDPSWCIAVSVITDNKHYWESRQQDRFETFGKWAYETLTP